MESRMYILPNGSVPYFKIGKKVRFSKIPMLTNPNTGEIFHCRSIPIYEFTINDIDFNRIPYGPELMARIERGEGWLTDNELWMLAFCVGNNIEQATIETTTPGQ